MDALKKPNGANSSPLTPLGFIERAAIVYADSPSIIYNDLTYTWANTFRRCLKLASSISRLTIKKSDVVSVLAPNIPATYELHFAVTMTGAVINTINTRLDARTISVILKHNESKLVFVDHQLIHLIQEAVSLLRDCKIPQLVLIEDNGPASGHVNKLVKFVNMYEAMVEAGDPGFNWVRPESDWDPMTLNYTSGTTSAPKGVVHSHRGTFMVAVDSLLEWGVPKQPVCLWTLPMFHANGWSYVWGMAAVGATNVCLRKFDASIIYSAIRTHHVTHMCGAPVVLNMLSNGETLSHPVHIMTAGARLLLPYCHDRSKDVIISGGENLSSVEVESVLYLHPAVVGRPDEFWGETPCAFVSLKDDWGKPAPTAEEIMLFCKGKLPGYMVPKTVVFKEDLPKTSTGKIQKFALREYAKNMGFAVKSRI
ncbi:hypothetical protein L1987_37048 [Smallanthus sonchifolius]|uniref:Uncharacterized protein n=1 Tax=Smallanthus sonchifolius TaxID=185202 RepID=A0ACB9HFR4_9ASTR|nr:hypothetical protein L1987_37048 [Smallanthus sonchifolius]